MKRFITIILAGTILFSSLSVSADNDFDYGYGRRNLIKEVEEYQPQDIGNLKGFSDIDNYDWAKSAIEDMSTGTYKGLFSGTTEPNEQGLAQFSPADKMTRAEFITVVVRLLYSKQAANTPTNPNEAWYQKYYDIATKNYLFNKNQYPNVRLDKPIPRQEMAYILAYACSRLGEETGELVDEKTIPDYNVINVNYRKVVLEVYTKGLITGIDDTGMFAPERTLTRAEAAIVLYRLANPSKRVNIKDKQAIIEEANAPITIYEGEQSKRVPAKEGDIFIKKDGTQIVLKKGPSGVVGEGQGVAPDLGMYGTNGGYVTAGDDWENQLMIGLIDERLHPYFVNGKGQSLNNNYYLVNATTGEGHWSSDWTIIEQTVAKPNYDGTTHGEVSKDAYSLYVWNDIVGMWVSNTTK